MITPDRMRRLAALSLALAACSAAAAEKADQPRALQGTWVRDTVEASDGVDRGRTVDTLSLDATGARLRRWARGWDVTHYDTTTTVYTRWRVVRDTATHAALLCLEKPGVGNVDCDPVRSDSTTLTLDGATFRRAH